MENVGKTVYSDCMQKCAWELLYTMWKSNITKDNRLMLKKSMFYRQSEGSIKLKKCAKGYFTFVKDILKCQGYLDMDNMTLDTMETGMMITGKVLIGLSKETNWQFRFPFQRRLTTHCKKLQLEADKKRFLNDILQKIYALQLYRGEDVRRVVDNNSLGWRDKSKWKTEVWNSCRSKTKLTCWRAGTTADVSPIVVHGAYKNAMQWLVPENQLDITMLDKLYMYWMHRL